MTTRDDMLTKIKSLAQPYLENDEKVITMAYGQLGRGWIYVLGLLAYSFNLTTWWLLVFTDRRILALKMGGTGWTKVLGEPMNFLWGDLQNISLNKSRLGIFGSSGDTLIIEQISNKTTFKSLRSYDYEEFISTVKTFRPDLIK